MNEQVGSVEKSRLVSAAAIVGRRLPVVWLAGCVALMGLLGGAPRARAEDMKPETLARCKRAAVMVRVALSKQQKGDTELGFGSGYFINGTGLMISNNHVVDPTHQKSPEEKQRFHYTQGKLTWWIIADAGTEDEKKWEGVVLYQNEDADQAILQVYDEEGEKLLTPNYLRALPESRLQKRMEVWALGFPGADSQKTGKRKYPEVTVTSGNVLDVPRTPAGRIPMVYTDVVARPGNSGGAMVDRDGFYVGTVTLMKKPEDREDSGGAKYSALVPSALSGEMIRYAFDLGKIPGGSDLTPFVPLLTQEDGRLNIPEFPRLKDQDVLFFDDGDRIYGQINTESITWDSPLGKIVVPISVAAYVMNNEEAFQLFLEGGNRIATEELDASFEFAPHGGAKTTQSFEDVKTIGFRNSVRRLNPPSGKVVILDSDLTHLNLSNVEGTAKFKTKIGDVDVKLDDIVRIDTNDDDEQVVTLEDGRRMSGQFSEDKYKATIATTDTPIEFSLHEVANAIVEMVRYRSDAVAGLELPGVLASSDRQVQRLVDLLESGDVASARAKVDTLILSSEFRQFPEEKQEQLAFLAAVAAMRAGDGQAAEKLLRKLGKADDVNISSYAKACADVLKRYEDFQFEGKPLSEKSTFVAAGQVLAREYIRAVRDLMKDLRINENEEPTRGQYLRTVREVKKNEDSMRVAAVFGGTDAEDELIRLWNVAFEASRREMARLDEEIKEKQGGGGGSNPGGARKSGARRGQGVQLAVQRELDELREQRKEAEETAVMYLTKLYDYGFRIKDPDVQARREQKDDKDDKDDTEPQQEEPEQKPEKDDDEP